MVLRDGLLALCLASLAASAARSDLLASPAEEREHLAGERAKELTASLRLFPGVLDARVHLTLPASPPAGGARPAPAALAVVVTHATGRIPDERGLAALLRTAVPELGDGEPRIFLVPAADREPLVAVGPLRVAASSAPLARGLLVGLAALLLVSGALLALFGHARHRARSGEGPPPRL